MTSLDEIRYIIDPKLYDYLKDLEAGSLSAYKFKSYGSDKQELLAEGYVIKTGTFSDGYVEVQVKENSTDPGTWVGEKFFVKDTAKADGKTFYELFTDAGTTTTGMFVKIKEMF
jgi:hypothetical protein